MEAMTKVFRVLEGRYTEFVEKIAKLNKKAAKLGCEAVSFQASDIVQKIESDEFGNKKLIEYRNVTVSGNPPQYAGWNFLGTIEHTPAGNILRSIPGREIPEQYRQVSTVCDHCNTKRNRKDTFVVQHESGETKQVGRQCIRDFLGHMSPEMIAQQCEFFMHIASMGEDDYFCGSGWGGKEVADVSAVLVYAVAAARKFGFVSRAKAEGRVRSTSAVVTYSMCPPHYSAEAMALWQKDTAGRAMPTDADRQYAETILAWVKNLNANGNQFLGNLKVALANEYCEHRDIGIICAAYAAHNREVGDPLVREQKEVVSKNEHFGIVGKRDVFEVTVVESRTYETVYGVGKIMKFRDNEGREAVWFASGSVSEFEVGATLRVKATVKGHEEYQGWAQTRLNRVVTVS